MVGLEGLVEDKEVEMVVVVEVEIEAGWELEVRSEHSNQKNLGTYFRISGHWNLKKIESKWI